jgi:hypothetical protein
MDSKFLGGFNWSPDFVTVMFTYNLSFGLKIRVYWQKIHHINVRKPQILGFLPDQSRKAFWVSRVTYCGLYESISNARRYEVLYFGGAKEVLRSRV